MNQIQGLTRMVSFALLQLMFISCHANPLVTHNKTDSLFHNTITIVVKNPFGVFMELSYRNKFNDNEILSANNDRGSIISMHAAFMPLRIKYADKNIMFPLTKGDSIEITSVSNKSCVIRSINDRKLEYDTLFLKYCNLKLLNEYQKLSTILSPGSPVESKMPLVRKNKTTNDEIESGKIYTQSKLINRLEWDILDSLVKDGRLSVCYRNVYGSLIDSRHINDVILCYTRTRSIKYLAELRKIEGLSKKEYLEYDAGQYKDMLNNYLTSVIARGKFYKYGINEITIDYKAAYDSTDFFLQNQVGAFVKFICVKKIKEQSTPSQFQQYFSKFRSDTRDIDYLSYFSQNFINSKPGLKGDDLLTGTIVPKQISIDSLISSKRGKIIYIDFWASWCAPCRKEMPASQQLRKQYGADKVAFIYISIDENLSAWKNASVAEQLNHYDDSYIFENPKYSSFLKENKVVFIPRYMIIDQNGKIANANAPAPGSTEIAKIFNQLVK